ncbi:MAG: efflux RND transporter periplasmic adaptor subunit [Alphaproteobacteria bacterium]|nr:efflux RND transporter periplasmic adaptor subunit [Alphaproteobacteria bacterium]
MKRVVEAFHVAKGSEKAVGLVQVVLVIAVVVGTISITKLLRIAGDSGPGFSAEQSGLVVDVIAPHETSHRPTVQVTGEVTARASVAISPQVAGRVVRVSDRLEPGALLSAGDILFEIDARDFELALERAEADVASAKADLLQTEASAENFTKDWYRVFPDKPAPTLVAKEPQVQALRARLKAAEANAAQARLNLERARYRAVFPARVVASSIERGQLVNAGGQYGSLYATDSLRVTAGIDPKDLARLGLEAGDAVRIASETNPTDSFMATVAQIGSVLDSRTRLQDIVVGLPEETKLVPGTFVTVSLNGPEYAGIYRLPIRALATSNTVWTVKAGKLESTPVDIVDTDHDHVYVRRFEVAEGVVVTEVPTSFTSRPVTIRARLEAGGKS